MKHESRTELPTPAASKRPRRACRGVAAGSVLLVAVALTLSACDTASPTATASSSATSSAPATATKDPATTTAVGSLVPGFPANLIGPMTGSKIVASAQGKSSQQTGLTVYSVNATVPGTLAAVQSHYQGILLTQGFAQLPPTASPTVSTYSYAKAGSGEVITITATVDPSAAGQVTYVAVASIAAARA